MNIHIDICILPEHPVSPNSSGDAIPLPFLLLGPVWDVRLLHIIALKCNNSKFEQKAKAPAPVGPKFLTSKIAKQISVKFLFPRKQPGQLA